MKRVLAILVASLPLALTAEATDFPKMETYLGYDFVRFNADSGFVPSFNANGGNGQFGYNFWKWGGAVLDVGAVNKGLLNDRPVDTTVIHFVAGPRFTYRNHSRYIPFGEVMFGGAYGTTSTQILAQPVVTPPIALPADGTIQNLNGPLSLRLQGSHTVFAMMAGGGLDIKIGKHAAFRPVEVDYYLTRPPSFVTGEDVNKNNWRYSAGVNFQFGAR